MTFHSYWNIVSLCLNKVDVLRKELIYLSSEE